MEKEIGRGCEGLVFTGFALLNRQALPGVPLTRIEPVERLVESFKLTIQGEENMSEKEKEQKQIEEKEKAEGKNEASEVENQPKEQEKTDEEPQTNKTEENKEENEEPKEREWDTAFINNLPDAAFAVIEPAYKRGEVKDKRARHLPHHGPSVKDPNENGSVDLPHLRNALARMNQIKPITDSISTEELRRRARTHLLRHAKALLKTYQEKFEDPEKTLILLELIEELERQIADVSTAVEELEGNVKEIKEKVHEETKSSENAEQESKEDSDKESEDNTQMEREENEQIEESKEETGETENDGSNEIKEEQKQPEKPCILTKEGFWHRFRELRKEGLSKSEAYRICTMEVLTALQKQNAEKTD